MGPLDWPKQDLNKNYQNPSDNDLQNVPPTTNVSGLHDPPLNPPDSDQSSQTVPLSVRQSREILGDMSQEPCIVMLVF